MEGSLGGAAVAGTVGALLVVIVVSASSAADMVFKAVLYNYATGKSVPENIDTSSFAGVFTPAE